MYNICLHLTCISSRDHVEHYPLGIKLEEVPEVIISGMCCSPSGVVFLSDKGRSLVYRIDLNDGTFFPFGKGQLSKSIISTSSLLAYIEPLNMVLKVFFCLMMQFHVN